jgi:probable HAF family extracellular repeat protein
MTGKRLRVTLLGVGVLVVLSLAVLLRSVPTLYRVTVLPRLGMRVVSPCAINDRGQIVGVCRGRFYLWQRGRDWEELGRAAAHSRDFYINDAGQIAGTMCDPNGAEQAFLWDPKDGLTTIGGGESVARALNNRGQIIGVSYIAGSGARAFLWDKAHGMRALVEVDGNPQAMNDVGQIVACRGEREPWQPVLWGPGEDGSMTETVLPPGAFCDLNNHGCVLGSAFNFDERKYYAFIWRKDRNVEWLFPLENQMARVAALNDANQVAVCEEVHVGSLEKLARWRFGPYKESFVWTREKGRVSLDGYVLDERGEYFQIADMNNHGCILGTVSSKSGEIRRTVLLEPIPKRWRK